MKPEVQALGLKMDLAIPTPTVGREARKDRNLGTGLRADVALMPFPPPRSPPGCSCRYLELRMETILE